MEKHTYKVSLVWTEERKGELTSPELDLKIEVATPPPFDKGIAGIWSPEHLFTASVLSCFMTTFFAIAEHSKLEYENFDCDGIGVLEQIEGNYLITEINLTAQLKIKDLEKKDRALRVLEKSKAACLVTNSIKSTVNLTSNITI
jgi:organic hydroperoxide reductase OsmC/OhrA